MTSGSSPWPGTTGVGSSTGKPIPLCSEASPSAGRFDEKYAVLRSTHRMRAWSIWTLHRNDGRRSGSCAASPRGQEGQQEFRAATWSGGYPGNYPIRCNQIARCRHEGNPITSRRARTPTGRTKPGTPAHRAERLLREAGRAHPAWRRSRRRPGRLAPRTAPPCR